MTIEEVYDAEMAKNVRVIVDCGRWPFITSYALHRACGCSDEVVRGTLVPEPVPLTLFYFARGDGGATSIVVVTPSIRALKISS